MDQSWKDLVSLGVPEDIMFSGQEGLTSLAPVDVATKEKHNPPKAGLQLDASSGCHLSFFLPTPTNGSPSTPPPLRQGLIMLS